jgi:hypothetical protein
MGDWLRGGGAGRSHDKNRRAKIKNRPRRNEAPCNKTKITSQKPKSPQPGLGRHGIAAFVVVD